jgi:surface antigen
MRFANWVVVGMFGLGLAGCQSLGVTPGDTAAVPGRANATVDGGLVGTSVGQALNSQARQIAGNAEFQALEYGRPGTPLDWTSRADRGEVIPGPRYRVNAYECRDYTHQVWIGGKPQIARGTACREADGTWRAVT